ncbi:hypothetical protein ACRALDRAFT_1071739 [Sodiomyces alcalophilus JCM 7366]|uniref:uncharacterized protein n=1 Tax=Sodiomyces alcalophilus JCM 7366 TaxID=591952 RepID=UPI0039B4E3CB
MYVTGYAVIRLLRHDIAELGVKEEEVEVLAGKAPKKNTAAAKKTAPAKKGVIKTGRVTKTAKKNTRKAIKDTANTATAADTATAATTDAATTPEGAGGSGSIATGAKERYSAKSPPPGFIGEKFNTPYKGYIKLLNRLRPTLRLF